MTNITRENPTYDIGTFEVHADGEHFRGVALDGNGVQVGGWEEFWWDRWGKWKHLLTPGSFHSFLCKRMPATGAKSKSGFDIKPFAHIISWPTRRFAQDGHRAWFARRETVWANEDRHEQKALAIQFARQCQEWGNEVNKSFDALYESGRKIFQSPTEDDYQFGDRFWVTENEKTARAEAYLQKHGLTVCEHLGDVADYLDDTDRELFEIYEVVASFRQNEAFGALSESMEIKREFGSKEVLDWLRSTQ